MSKAILVMDMPHACIDCLMLREDELIPLGGYTYKKTYKCRAEPEDIEDGYLEHIISEKPDWCPLREVPQKQEEYYENKVKDINGRWITMSEGIDSVAIGYNACIDEIMKGSEENK